MDCWNKILKDEGPRAFFKVCLWINQYNTYLPFSFRAISQMYSGPLVARLCLWDTTSASLCWKPTSSPTTMPASPVTSRQNMIMLSNQDHVTKASNMQHISQDQWLVSFQFDHVYHLRSDTPVFKLTDPGTLLDICQKKVWYLPRKFGICQESLAFAEKVYHIQGSVFTPNCENSIRWNKLCYLN